MSTSNAVETKEKRRCFIITPIGSESDPIRRHIDGIINAAIRPALESNYIIEVAHKISEPGTITKQIINEIYNDDLVIANLTNNNPNVMYELAFRHSLGKPVILIAEKGTPLPSDIIMERTIFYQNDAQGIIDLREELKSAEASVDFSKKTSPIYSILHEVDKDAKIVELSRSTQNDEANVLEHILNRLNSIESTVQTSRFSQSLNSRKINSDYVARFEYTISPKSKKVFDQKVIDEIITALNKEFPISSVSINTNEDDRAIDICVYFSKPIKSFFRVENVLINTIKSFDIEIIEFKIS